MVLGAPRASLDKEIAAASLLDLSKGGDQPGRKEDDEAADGDENKGMELNSKENYIRSLLVSIIMIM